MNESEQVWKERVAKWVKMSSLVDDLVDAAEDWLSENYAIDVDRLRERISDAITQEVIAAGSE